MKHLNLLFLSVLLSISVTTDAQKNVTYQSMYWLRYYGKYSFSKEWTASLEVEDRRFAFPDRQQYWVLPRIVVLHKFGDSWDAGLGFTYYLNNSPGDPHKPTQVTIPELRPHEQLDFKQKIGKVTVGHRYKLEERFSRKTSGNKLVKGYDFNFRFRYQVQFEYPLSKKASGPGALHLRAFDEIMLNFGSRIVRNTFDQNRYFIGLNYTLSKHWQAEFGYLNWFQEKSSGDDYYDRNCARLTFYHLVKF